jgi:hypothetical protein
MKMFKSIVIAGLAATGITASAEGFKCLSADEALAVKVFGAALSSPATREAQVMVVSDRAISHGRKTVAKFTAANGTLSNRGSRYTGDVDLRFSDTGRAGENIGGTKLGELDQVVLTVDFSHQNPLQAGELASGLLSLVKRNGEVIEIDLACARYLKGE